MATRIDLVEDVLPISELRLRAAQQITKIQDTQRPLVITQYGKAVAVLMEVSQFQAWQDRLTMLEEKMIEMERTLMKQQQAALQAQLESALVAAAPNADATAPTPDGTATPTPDDVPQETSAAKDEG